LISVTVFGALVASNGHVPNRDRPAVMVSGNVPVPLRLTVAGLFVARTARHLAAAAARRGGRERDADRAAADGGDDAPARVGRREVRSRDRRTELIGNVGLGFERVIVFPAR